MIAIGVNMLALMGLILAGIMLLVAHHVWELGGVVAGALFLFSGAIFPLEVLPIFLRPIGYLMPVTYSITNLQDVMLKGIQPSWYFLVALGAMGLVLFLFSWWRYRRSLVMA